jgi:hypothetical protein
MIWLGLAFLLLVHWLVGNVLGRIMMFGVLVVAVCYMAAADPNRSFVPPDIFFGSLMAWFIAGIPHRYRKRSNARAANAIEDRWWAERERQRLADREIPNWR